MNRKDLKGRDTGHVPFAGLFKTFFRIGLFTLGGGLAMSPVIRHELVIKRRWVKDADFMAVMSLATVVPGAIAVNIAYLLGRRLRGGTGSCVAVLGTVLPSFIVILFIAVFLLPSFEHPQVTAFFHGCAVAIVGQLAFAGYIFGRKLLRRWFHFAVCASGLIVVGLLGAHPILGLITAGVFGFWLCSGDTSQESDRNADLD
ncbi:MAG: chromate transporter [Candidatus Omnitrophota bacterium]